MPRTIALGDLHLVRDSPAGLVDDLVALLQEHAGARVVLAGDSFDLSADHPRACRGQALRAALGSLPRVRAALAEHVDRGGELWFLGGNHDAALGDPALRAELVEALGVRGDATGRVRSSPWFLREGGLHLEHGHLYDPDNATTHPLASDAKSLGVHFVEEFIAPTGAFRYLNANDGTPLELFVSAFSWYGKRAPYVVYKYFDTAFRAVARSGPFYEGLFDAERAEAREAEFMRAHGLDEALVRSLRHLGERPTMASLVGTFQRLYLDRVAGTVAVLLGLGALAAGRTPTARLLIGAGALALGVSWALGFDRYGGTVPERLARGAERVAEGSGARLVVLGHAHREALTERYANTGSFAFPRGAPGRPFLEIEGSWSSPRAVRRYFAPAS